MRYHVAQLLKETVGATREYAVAETRYPFEGSAEAPLSGTVHMLRTPRGILVTAALATAVTEECSRCLDPLQQGLDLAVEEEFFPLTDIATGMPLEVPEEAGPFVINEKHILDLMEVVRQAILLARPMQPLCRESCAGLCPECGTNLNRSRCDCRRQTVDPRWGSLAQRFGSGLGNQL